ncbi:MAG TPA: glycosyltransferase [Gemmatimonadaceae bacterium]|nr:glycosyltransferase [Gemmatimonadaceae bacterium]
MWASSMRQLLRRSPHAGVPFARLGPTAPPPLLSVVVPTHRCAAALRRSAAALLASDLPRVRWELIVVDDSSGDETVEVAERLADRVVRLTGGPHGPACARNRGVEVARGRFIVFVDADVCVHVDTLRRLREALVGDDGLGAVFGAYDAAPPERGLVSQYRNLVHHYTHVQGAGNAVTFWTGCGAVRRDVFLAIGGFDERRFPRPQIEDVELGQRIVAAGYRIMLRPDIQATHLKRWTLRNVITTDVRDRGLPWVALLHSSPIARRMSSLNLRPEERLYTALTGLAWLAVALAAVTRRPEWLTLAAFGAAMVIVGNGPLLAWFARRRGPWVAVGVVPLRLIYYTINDVAVVWGTGRHLLRRLTGRADDRPAPPQPSGPPAATGPVAQYDAR